MGPGYPGENLYVMPYKEHCVCMTTECECITIDGTGHTSTTVTYYDSTAYTSCELACCSGVTVEVCDVLIVGKEEGICKYDVANNLVTKLFEESSVYYDIIGKTQKEVLDCVIWEYINSMCDVIGDSYNTN